MSQGLLQTPSGGRLLAPDALLANGWQRHVLLEWHACGKLHAVQTLDADGVSQARAQGVPLAAGPLIPGVCNLHSHAFQRAMAGRTEVRHDPADSFWSWRTLMYRFAARLTPQHIAAISTWLYIEMLKAGYTSVCEFHYVHHDIGGTAYERPEEHALQLINAARDTGLGLTLLPVLYEHSGFAEQPPLPHQARFISSPDWILTLLDRLRQCAPADRTLQYGVAPHSLRAVSAASLQHLVTGLTQADPLAPVHIHIAEQRREVEDCLAFSGRRPVEYLLDQQAIDARWCLVHATHMSAAEYSAVARSGAVVGLCPTTEANLGDGLFDAPSYFAKGGRWGIGSDSHISVSLNEELRWLEYGQRLQHQQRNVLADDVTPDVATRLFQGALQGGAQASGRAVDGLQVGQQADFLVLNADHPALVERQPEALLSGFIFSGHGGSPIRDVYTAGRKKISEGHHPLEVSAFAAYRQAIKALMS